MISCLQNRVIEIASKRTKKRVKTSKKPLESNERARRLLLPYKNGTAYLIGIAVPSNKDGTACLIRMPMPVL